MLWCTGKKSEWLARLERRKTGTCNERNSHNYHIVMLQNSPIQTWTKPILKVLFLARIVATDLIRSVCLAIPANSLSLTPYADPSTANSGYYADPRH